MTVKSKETELQINKHANFGFGRLTSLGMRASVTRPAASQYVLPERRDTFST